MTLTSAPVRHFASIDSTNLEAGRLCTAGEVGPLWIRADQQSAGMGRLGRTWMSPPGNLYSTLLLPVDAPIEALPQLGFVMSLAVHDTVRAFAGNAIIGLKWPNDCLIEGAKVAGILCEVLSTAPSTLALGCGINVVHAPTGLPYPATSLQQFGQKSSASDVFQVYSGRLASWLDIWNCSSGFEAIRTAWQSRAIGIGESVQLQTSQALVKAIYVGIDARGALLLKSGSSLQSYHAGDLSIPSLNKLRSRV